MLLLTARCDMNKNTWNSHHIDPAQECCIIESLFTAFVCSLYPQMASPPLFFFSVPILTRFFEDWSAFNGREGRCDAFVISSEMLLLTTQCYMNWKHLEFNSYHIDPAQDFCKKEFSLGISFFLSIFRWHHLYWFLVSKAHSRTWMLSIREKMWYICVLIKWCYCSPLDVIWIKNTLNSYHIILILLRNVKKSSFQVFFSFPYIFRWKHLL